MSARARRRLPGLIVAVAALLAAAGCTNSSTAGSTTASTLPGGGEVVTNGTVTVGVRSLPTNFNPSTTAGDNQVTQMVMEQVWPQPFVVGPSFALASSPLIESAEVLSISPLTVSYVIDPAATWSDGEPITAADFVYNWHEHLARSAALADSGLVAGYRAISSITASDGGRTVTVTFSTPYAQWQDLFANLVPAEIGERYGWTRAFEGFSPARVLSGGPFEISSFVPGRVLVLSRNPRYWGTPAHVAHIRFVVESSRADLVDGLRSGALQVAEVASTGLEPGLVSVSSAGRGRPRPSDPVAWSLEAESEVYELCFNESSPLTSQLTVRRAIEHAIDRSEIVADSEGLADAHARAAVSRFSVAGEDANPESPSSSPVVQRTPSLYNAREALGQFRLAGYEPGAGGLLREGGSGPPLELGLLAPSGNAVVDQAAEVIQAELRALGVTVEVTTRPLAEMLADTLPRGRYEMALAPFPVETDFAAMAPLYTGPVDPAAAGSGSTAAWTTAVAPGTEPGARAAGFVTRDVLGSENQGVADELSAALEALDTPTAFADLQRAESWMYNQAVTVPLFQPSFELGRSDRVDNVTESPTWAGIMWDAQDWAVLRITPESATAAS